MDLDSVDRQILAVLRKNARTTVTEIAHLVGLSAAPTSRRIERMEREGIIKGYTAVIDESRTGIEAYTEVRLVGATETAELDALARDIPEVHEVLTISGDVDALVRFRVNDVEHLQQVVNALRRTGRVASTRTLIVLHRWSRAASAVDR